MNASEIANKYQKKTDKQHILDNPDTYIGSVEEVDADMWVFDESTNRIVLRRIRYIPGLYKLFDEGLVNCRDHMVRMLSNQEEGSHKVSNIQISIDSSGMITMMNDGNGIDVVMHPETNVWVPEMIFGHLRTSTNYDKTEKKIVGGKNGFGVKLAYVWSTIGSVETVDHKTGQKYEQTFEQNLDIIHPPTITKVKASTKPYTKITFLPDYARLGVPGLSPDMLSLFKKRVYDLSAITDKSVKIRYNGDILPTKNFSSYVDLYIGSKEETKRLHEEDEEGGGRWEYLVAISPTHEFCQVSFVNGIHTQKGGKHVEYILNQITRKVCTYIETKKKLMVNPTTVKEQLILFIRCDIENPSFDSQTKDYMNTPSTKFGSYCNVSDKFIEKLCKMGVMEAACALTELKEFKASKKNDGVKVKTLRGMTKLMDASLAGTDRSRECVLILCEGDSAKAGIVSGLTTEDRATIGVFPLKGKLLNVRGESAKKINENEEIRDIKKILGLERERTYGSMEDIARHLRYGQVLFMTDQDLDGSHIKGLCINLFQSEWKSLAMIPGFIGFMNTPILKARRGKDELLFYNQGEYESWKEDLGEASGRWEIKYYKGLGTSTDKEFKQYFKNKKVVSFIYNEESDDMIDMVFNKKRADDRKAWLEKYERTSYLNTSESAVSYSNFINKELIHFSKYDCDRSIPNVMDGLKRSLRKILFSAFKKNLTKEIKVAQFSGYVSEHSGYHHGEASLNAAIVNMAQNFVGSNNINLFVPNGQFGSRMMGGKDSASERYIFTLLSNITRHLYPEVDDPVLTYLDDDGTPVEPLYYMPIIPMVLVNGCKGIGTGFSTSIPCYDPLLIIAYLKQLMTGGSEIITEKDFVPYYEGFKGTITRASDCVDEVDMEVIDPLDETASVSSAGATGKKSGGGKKTKKNIISNENKFIVQGVYQIVGPDQVRITELPIGTWTNDYKDFLEGMVQPIVDKDGKKVPNIIKDYIDNSTKNSVNMLVTFQKGKLAEFGDKQLIKLLRLSTSLSTNNMHLFDPEDKLKKYTGITEIIGDYFGKRLELYSIRKEWLVANMERELVKLSNRAKYIQYLLVDRIDLRRKTKDQVFDMLQRENFDLIDGEYTYLTKMPMDSVTAELVDKIMREKGNKEAELDILRNKNEFDMWIEELAALEVEYQRFREERVTSMAEDVEEPVGKAEDGKKKKKAAGGGGGGGGGEGKVVKNKKVPINSK
jgi:DNA topoisomerase-2